MTQPERTKREESKLPLFLMLLAMGIRMLYAPIHLAQEEHFGSAAHSFSHVVARDHHDHKGHAHHKHEHSEHDHDEHPPHPAEDHVAELVITTARTSQALVATQAMLASEGWSHPAVNLLSSAVVCLELRPPRSRPRLVQRQRGPPSAS
ncbi:MAG: hypothetical protein ACI8X5_000116 [Planctomycetota bacterium]|jgi:hypothetical protein